ncbi:MAG: porin family protein [Duncaniella sp.]|nr:porin family protein [Duncaniella sp.]
MKSALPTLTAFLLICAIAFAGLRATAQATAQPEEYKFDLGAGIGVSGYMGDANESKLFSHPGVGGNISLRYLINTRFAIRGLINMASLSGSTADMENVLPTTEPIDFKASVYDLQARGEFNFFNYGIGETYKRLTRITPYMALGLGISMTGVSGDTSVAMTLPMAVGVKYKVKPRLNLSLEFSMTKVFGDKVDGPELSDPYLIKSSFIKNTDWYSMLTFSVSYEFGRRCVACHRID